MTKEIDLLNILECTGCEITLVIHSYTNTHFKLSCLECDYISEFIPRLVTVKD